MSDSVMGASSLASSLIGEGDGSPPNLKSLFNSPSEGRDATELALREVNALKISTSDTDIGGISAIGTDLVGTSFQCHSHGTVFQ